MNCTRKHTLVTGSSSGIGRAPALRLAAAGQHVYAGVRIPADGDRLVRRQLDVNVTGQLAVTQAMLPALRRARGRIVMVSTIGVRFSPPFAGPLDTAKAALTALGEALRQELAPWGFGWCWSSRPRSTAAPPTR